MLERLQIRNFALIEELELEFANGMNVLTGETGAGKSILLDALGLALGDRADSAMVRHGSERAEISAEFALNDCPGAAQWLKEQELDSDGECIIRRTVSADGRSRGYINGQASTLQQLRELGELMVDIHGQHAHQSLMRREVQRRTLDAYAGHLPLATQVADACRNWQALNREYERLREANSDREARLELLRYQVEELHALEPDNKELKRLEEEQRRLAHLSQLQANVEGAVNELLELDSGAITDRLGYWSGEVASLTDYDAELGSAAEMLESATIQAREAATELRHYLSNLDNDPQRLVDVEQRLDAYLDLARKHRVEPEALTEQLATLEQELSQLDGAGTRLDELEQEIETALAQYNRLADKLSKQRHQAASKLGEEVSANMHQLGMCDGRFSVELVLEEPGAPSPHGSERVEFQVSANAGQPLRPLSKVASGGELSRISLALQVLIAHQEGVPTLIFDEVDVGVGGGVAEMVGRELRTLGAERQVLCVTHQPQVASQGHAHYRISKRSDNGTTFTDVTPLDNAQRIEEVARMLGGVEITEQTRSHAEEMLQKAV